MQKKLCDCCDFYAGTGFPEIYQGNSEGEYPFYKVGDISSNVIAGNVYLNHCENYISKNVVSLIQGTLIPEGTVVFAKIGEALKKNRRAITKSDCLVDNNAMGIAPHTNLLRTKYFYYFMLALKMEKYAEATAVPSVRKTRLEQVSIYIPTIEQQTQIETLLDSLSTVISLRQRQLRTLDVLIKARFVEMFGDPIINDRGWQQITLLDSLETGRTVTYGIVQTGDEYENGTPVFRPIDIAGGHVPKREELKKTDPLISAQYKRTLLKGNELLITVRGSVGETFQTTKEFEGCNVGRNIVPLVTDSSKVLQRFLQELFAQDAIKNWLKGITKGIALQGLNMGEFKEMPVVVPPKAKQKAFVDFAMQVDKSKVVVQAALDEAQLLFDSLMQQYFG